MYVDSDFNSDLDLPSVNFCSSSLTGGIVGHSEEHTKGVDNWKGQIALVPLIGNTCTNQNINGSYFNQLNIHLLTSWQWTILVPKWALECISWQYIPWNIASLSNDTIQFQFMTKIIEMNWFPSHELRLLFLFNGDFRSPTWDESANEAINPRTKKSAQTKPRLVQTS